MADKLWSGLKTVLDSAIFMRRMLKMQLQYNFNKENPYNTNMKGLIFFLFLLAHTSIVWAGTVEGKEVFIDTLDNEIFETDPEINEEEYARKRKLFTDSLLNYLATHCIETVLKIQDNIVVGLIVNSTGKVDSVWLAYPKEFPFEDIYKFIKNYDFKGQLMQLLLAPHRKHACTVRVVLAFDRQRSRLGIGFDCLKMVQEIKYKWRY